jgi:hypothetical protein
VREGDDVARAHDVEGDLERDTRTSSINDTVTAEAIALHGPGFGIANDDLAAVVLAGQFKTMRVLWQTNDGDLRTALLRHGGA